MTERSRRAFLAAAGSAALAATAGCSDLPVVGDDDGGVEYDTERLQSVAEPDAEPASPTYPGPVPDALAADHYERGRELLAAVPAEPEIPNEAVAEEVAADRADVADALADPPGDVATLDALDEWRRDRARAAEVRGAYAAATGTIDPEALRERRAAVREDLHAFRGDWAYRARSVVEAVVVHERLELLARDAENALVAEQSFPDDPKRAVSTVGSLVRGVEAASANVADAAALRDAYRESSMTSYRDAVATAASRLQAVTLSTRRRVAPYVSADAEPADFDREITDTPAERLFSRAALDARTAVETTESAFGRDEYAQAVTRTGRALVALVALEAVVEAIRDGEYGMPSSTEGVVEARQRAVDALEAVAAGPLADRFAWQARQTFDDADHELGGYRDYEYDDGRPNRNDVRDAVANYALVAHAADAVAPVAERVRDELRAAAGEGGGSESA